MIGTYTIQQWLFDSAQGRYEIDLAKSAVQHQRVADLTIEPDWELNYSQDRGLLETRAAVAALYGDGWPAERVLLAHGGQEALYLFYQSLLVPGDHVVTVVPGWQQSWEVPAHIGCEVAKLHWRPGRRLDPRELARLLRPDTRLIVLNSPGNPSGCVISPQEWDDIFELAGARGTWIMSDEEYVLDFRASAVHGYGRCLSVSGMSKVHGLQGLRLGWAVAGSAEGAELLERMVNYKRYTSICNSMLCEHAAARVLRDWPRQVRRYHALLAEGLEPLQEFARANADAVTLVPPQGTPFAWFDVELPVTSMTLCERLLDAGVLVMPAEVLGSERGFRLTYARPREVLLEGLERFSAVLKEVAAGV